VVALGDVSAQMRQALQNLRIALEESGAAIPDVLKTTVYVASSDRSDLATAWDEVARFFGDHDVPSTLLGVAVLGYPGQLVEIEAIAVAPSHLAPTEPGRTPTVSEHGLTFETERRIGMSTGQMGILQSQHADQLVCTRPPRYPAWQARACQRAAALCPCAG
jgi:hypothetical protein